MEKEDRLTGQNAWWLGTGHTWWPGTGHAQWLGSRRAWWLGTGHAWWLGVPGDWLPVTDRRPNGHYTRIFKSVNLRSTAILPPVIGLRKYLHRGSQYSLAIWLYINLHLCDLCHGIEFTNNSSKERVLLPLPNVAIDPPHNNGRLDTSSQSCNWSASQQWEIGQQTFRFPTLVVFPREIASSKHKFKKRRWYRSFSTSSSYPWNTT